MIGLTPRDFWSMSFCEWRALTDGRFGRKRGPALARHDLENLMEAYPDD